MKRRNYSRKGAGMQRKDFESRGRGVPTSVVLANCHPERGDLSCEATAKQEGSSEIPQRASTWPYWILHFVQNDNPDLKTPHGRAPTAGLAAG
jgi:hypothetical protein